MSDNVNFSIQTSATALMVSVNGIPRFVVEDLGNQVGATAIRDARGVARVQFNNDGEGYGLLVLSDAEGSPRFEARIGAEVGFGTKIFDDERNLFQFVRGLIIQRTFRVMDLPDVAGMSIPAGARSIVTDANNPCFLKPATGGGTVTAPVYCDGAIWRIG